MTRLYVGDIGIIESLFIIRCDLERDNNDNMNNKIFKIKHNNNNTILKIIIEIIYVLANGDIKYRETIITNDPQITKKKNHLKYSYGWYYR